MVSAMVTVFVTLLGIQTQAANACYGSHLKSSYYGVSFTSLRDLNRATEILVEKIEKNSAEMKADLIQNEVSKISELSEEYFKAAGIGFEKKLKYVQIDRTADGDNYNIFYPYFQISGSAKGDEVARLIHGIQRNPKFQGKPPMFIFDPMYMLNYPGSRGSFVRQTKAILVGVNTFAMAVLGVATTLRHESQHYIENMKISRGEMTLARLEMNNYTSSSYKDFLMADEMEAHLRDLRSLRNKNRNNSIDAKLDNLLEEGKLVNVKEGRVLGKRYNLEKMQLFSDLTLQTIEALEVLTKREAWQSVQINQALNALEVSFVLSGTNFRTAKLDMTGILTLEQAQDKNLVRQKVLEVLSWNKQRIQKINQEVHEQ